MRRFRRFGIIAFTLILSGYPNPSSGENAPAWWTEVVVDEPSNLAHRSALGALSEIVADPFGDVEMDETREMNFAFGVSGPAGYYWRIQNFTVSGPPKFIMKTIGILN